MFGNESTPFPIEEGHREKLFFGGEEPGNNGNLEFS